MWYHGYGLYEGGMFFMMLIPVLFFGVLIYLGFKLVDKSKGQGSQVADNALEILNERFARGEIDEAEYLQKKSLLTKK